MRTGKEREVNEMSQEPDNNTKKKKNKKKINN